VAPRCAIKNLLRALPALALCVPRLPSPATTAPDPGDARPTGGPASAGRAAAASKEIAPPAGTGMPLFQALTWIEEAPEGPRTGYRCAA
jgi:hypothetical protein